MLWLSIVTLLLLAAGTTAVILSVRMLKKRVSQSVNQGSTNVTNDIENLDAAISKAIESFSTLISLDRITECEEQKTRLLTEIEGEASKLKRKEKELESAQANVDQQEQRHSELKKGNEGATELAGKITEEKDQLEQQFSAMKAEFEQSRAQINTFMQEAAKTLPSDQKKSLTELHTTLEKSHSQLEDLVQVYELAAQRFQNLERQYTELEKEYRRLVDREISGNL